MIDDLEYFALIERIATELAVDVTDPAALDRAVVRRSLRHLRKAELLEFAVSVVHDRARSKVRVRVLDIERQAERRAEFEDRRAEDEARRADRFRGKHGTAKAYRHGCNCDLCTQRREAMDEINESSMSRLTVSLGGVIADYAAEVRMGWTEELLASSFAIDNTGATVTWGEATVEQHERRIAMLTANAAANVETAARHRSAVDTITSLGVQTLADAVNSEVAA